MEKDLIGEEKLALYRRKFDSPPENWVGRYGPGDEARPDREALAEWLVWYRIESVPFEKFRNRSQPRGCSRYKVDRVEGPGLLRVTRQWRITKLA